MYASSSGTQLLATLCYRAFARAFPQLLTLSERRPEKLSKLGIKVCTTCKAQKTRCAT